MNACTHPASKTETAPAIHAALEVSSKSWVLAIGDAFEMDRISIHRLAAADTGGLLLKLEAAWLRAVEHHGYEVRVMLVHEAGYEGFWLYRFLHGRVPWLAVMRNKGLPGQRINGIIPFQDCLQYSSYTVPDLARVLDPRRMVIHTLDDILQQDSLAAPASLGNVSLGCDAVSPVGGVSAPFDPVLGAVGWQPVIDVAQFGIKLH